MWCGPPLPNGDKILFGEAVDSEDQASRRHGRNGAAQDAMRLYYRVADYFPTSPLAGEAMYRSADIRWQLEKADVSSRPSARERESYLREGMEEKYMKEVIKKFPGTKWADLAAFHLIDNKLCGDWQGSSKCPVKESEIYEKYATEHPQSPAVAEALYDAAWRWSALIEIYKTEEEPKKSEEARGQAIALAQKAASQTSSQRLGDARPAPALSDRSRRPDLRKCHPVRCRGRFRLAGKGLLLLMLMGLGMALSLQPGSAQDSASTGKMARPGVKEFQVPFASLKPEATFKIGEDADWVQITDDAVWVASSNPASVHRIDPKTNKEVAIVPVPGDPCAGLAFGFGSLWVPLCGKPNSMVRVDATTNKIAATLAIGPAGQEGGIAASQRQRLDRHRQCRHARPH